LTNRNIVANEHNQEVSKIAWGIVALITGEHNVCTWHASIFWFTHEM